VVRALSPPEIIAETRHGKVRGRRQGGVVTYWGVPFAAPPTGRLRFALPRPAAAWNGVRDATEPPPAAPQRSSTLGAMIGMGCPDQSEDCLRLNVWTPQLPEAPPRADRPVMVWIHGGGFAAGSASIELANGAELAARGDVVVVSVQYRLGAIGLLHLDGVPDNRAIFDQIAALRWVADNVAAFGGDPRNVTVFGSSAGGVSTALLLAADAARGLFRRAIVQSGNAETLHRPSTAVLVRRAILAELGLRPDLGADALVERLAKIPADLLVEAQSRATVAVEGHVTGVPMQPVVDAVLFPEVPLATLHARASGDVDLLVGTNLDEMKLGVLEQLGAPSPTEHELLVRVEELLGDPGGEARARAVIGRYRRWARCGDLSTRALWEAIATDYHFRVPAIRLADAHARSGARAHHYLFGWQSPALAGLLGACHAMEIPFLFGTHSLPLMRLFLGEGPDRDALSRCMQDAWLSFARTGDPSTAESGPWATWQPFARRAMAIDAAGIHPHPGTFDDETSLWSPIFGEVRPVLGVDFVRRAGDPPRRLSEAPVAPPFP
jgi:para-nitrobenzyl esterase